MSGNQEAFQKAMNQGHSAAWDQNWENAAGFYRQALVEAPDHPKALASLGLALFELQDFEEALAVYQRAAGISPEDPLPFEKIAQIYERLGRLKESIQISHKAADLYIKQHDVEKAIENWLRVTRFNSENFLAHSRLAVAYEHLGRKAEAVTEYLAVASLVQRPGDMSRSRQAVEHALQILPDSSEAHNALSLVKANQALPKPARTRGGTGPMIMAQVRMLEGAAQEAEEEQAELDPIAEARQKALITLADILFEGSEEEEESPAGRRNLKSITRGSGLLGSAKVDRNKIILYLSQMITAQTQGQEAEAASELERAVEAGLDHPAAHFDLGLLRSKKQAIEEALPELHKALKHPDYNLAACLLMGQILQKLGRLSEASVQYLEALKLADVSTVPQDQADNLYQLYEPLIEAQTHEEVDENALKALCDNINAQLMRKDWKEYLRQARQQLPTQPEGSQPLPLAEMMLQTGSGQIVESIARIHWMADNSYTLTALEEAYNALDYAPTYLPLHILIGDLTLKDNRVQDAIDKFMMVANTYSARGEASQSISLLERILALAPADMVVRSRLIDQLIAQGEMEEAIQAYMDMADIYYRGADLDNARKTYMVALRLCQQTKANRSLNVEILNHMADIDMQRLDWRQAVRVFEQIRTLQPGDEKARVNLIELNTRLGQETAAMNELDSYISYLDSNQKSDAVIQFLLNLVAERPDAPELHKRLAEKYRQEGRAREAIAELDTVGELLMRTGDKAGAVTAIKTILSLKPSNAADYQSLLTQIQGSK